MAHHLRRIADDELPVIEEDDGTERAATSQELADHGLHRAGTDPATDAGIYAVPCADPCPGHPGVEISTGFLNDRHGRIPPWLRDQVLRARVYRSTDGRVNLRRRLERDLGVEIPARQPRLGRRPDRDPRRRDEVLERLRELAADNAEPVEAREVPMAEVEDSDIVEDDFIYPVRFAGEISRR